MTHQLFEEEEHTQKYRLHRPGYPKQLYEYILHYYFDDHNQHDRTDDRIPLALDVGCGNGQATVDLSLFCDRVIGIDVSASQISQAIRKDNVEYRCECAEDLTFLPSDSVDLITIATSLHWVDIDRFVEEVKRVLKPKIGVLAVWTYALGTLDNPLADAIYQKFHQIQLFPYWNRRRWLADDYYQSLVPLLPYRSTLEEHTIQQRTESSIEKFLGFLQSLSACQTYRKQEGEQAYQTLLDTFREQMIHCYRRAPSRNDHEETIDCNTMKFTVANPIRLYLMRKTEPN